MRALGTATCARAILPLLILFCMPVIFASCAEDENPVGFDRSGRVIDSQVREIILRANSSYATIPDPLPATGTSRSILVGSEERSNSIGLLRFDAIPDTAGLLRVSLMVHLRRGRGGPLDLSLARVQGGKGAWSASEVTWGTRPRADEDPIATERADTTTTIDSVDSVDFAVPPSLLGRWRAEPDSNGGFQIACAAGTGTARIISHNDVWYGETYRIATPSLHLVYLDSDREETIVLATADAYVTEDLRPNPAPSDPTAWVTAGPATRFRLRFDLDPLLTAYPHASIVRATLILPVAQRPDSMLLGAYAVTDSSGAPATNAAGLSNDIDIVEPFEPFELEIGGLVQSWVDGDTNYGLVVRAKDEVSTMEGILFHTTNAAADTLRPRLRVRYVAPPGARWPVTP